MGLETISLADAATAQDIVTRVVMSPLLAILGVLASRGSLTSYLAWLGFLGFTVYNGLIYVFSIHFGPLFLVWVAVLGLSVFALIGGRPTLRFDAASERLAGRPMRRVAWFLIAVAVPFAMLWLGEIVPARLSRSSPSSADDWAVPTNPVHVLDMSFFLPAVVVTGAPLFRRRPAHLANTDVPPILVTPFVADHRGHEPGWVMLLPIGVMLAMTVSALTALLRTSRPRALERPA